MSFINVINDFDLKEALRIIKNASDSDVYAVLLKDKISFNDYLVLLSDAASFFLEDIAKKAKYTESFLTCF